MDIFHQPGLCDLTANVDFAYLKEAMSDLGGHLHFWYKILCRSLIRSSRDPWTHAPGTILDATWASTPIARPIESGEDGRATTGD